MKKFLLDNPTIAFGLGLPLLLVAVFLLISGIPALLVAPPQYDAIYATGTLSYQNGVRIGVVENKVQVSYQGSVLNHQNPRLWRYHPATGGVTEIAIILPAGLTPPGPNPVAPEANSRITPISIPDLASLHVEPSSVAPDGYEFSAGTDGYSGHMFTGMFYSSRYQNQAVMKKNGRSIRLPTPDGMYYGGSPQFIGWVIPK